MFRRVVYHCMRTRTMLVEAGCLPAVLTLVVCCGLRIPWAVLKRRSLGPRIGILIEEVAWSIHTCVGSTLMLTSFTASLL
eukprot:2179413-Amphidinium_carterae.1